LAETFRQMFYVLCNRRIISRRNSSVQLMGHFNYEYKNTNMKIALSAIALILSSVVTYAKEEAKTLVEIAAGNKDFSTLVAAVKAADLAETLSGKGPFTIFAPTNAAFEKLPKGTVEDLLKPENKAKLASILTYHVVSGKVMAKDVKAGAVKTVNGAEAKIATEDKAVTIDSAKVVKTDIEGSNGVIHIIDSVILPAAK
jgi:uncharacterized surface protein with fasciclin (FAS1) repeats